MRGYKVVELAGRKKMSWSGGRNVRYLVGKFVRPDKNCGPLCVFTDLYYAERLKTVFDAIYRCEFTPSTATRVWDSFGEAPVDHLSFGTRLATRVKLIRRVK